MSPAKKELAVPEAQATDDNSYTIRPNFKDKFKPTVIKDLIHSVLAEELDKKTYDPEQAPIWCKNITEVIKEKIKGLGMDRYKFAVNVVIGEQRGQGIKVGCRCFWDSDTDNYAQDVFMNDSLFCLATAFGVFYY